MTYRDNSLEHVAVPIAGGAYSHETDFTLYGPGVQVATTFLNGVPISQTFRGSIFIQAEAHSITNNGINLFPNATADAYIDPVIAINPLFLQQLGVTGGTIALSQGIANARTPLAAVPEPRAWTLLIAGFGLTGSMLRRRREVAA